MKTPAIRFRFLVVTLLFSALLHAQTNPADLYRDSIRATNSPLQLMRLYASLGESLYLSDPDSALYFFNAGDSVAQLVPAAERNASYYSRYAPLLNNIAFIAQKRGNILLAVHLYERCLEAHRASGDTSLIGSVYLNLGKLYSETGEKDLGLLYYGLAKKAIPATEEVGQAYCQDGIGKIFFLQGNYESALNCYYSALNLFRRAEHSVGETRTQVSIGQLYFTQKLLDASRDCFRQSLALAINDSNLQAQAESYFYLGEIALRYHQDDSALYFGEKALALSNASGFPKNIRDAASLLYRIYKSKGNTSDALRMHELFSTMNDSLNNVEKSNAVIREKLSADFENRSVQLKAEEEKKTAVATEAARLQKTINYFGAAALLLTVI
ncbi:MAG TPA: tetratricopeptide repeat protein, partial [Bacteroidia bacterium]|nr:tetratricopeptide repeat protein [Bacteroidia bacterium]